MYTAYKHESGGRASFPVYRSAMTDEERLDGLERRMSLLLEGISGTTTEKDSTEEMDGFKTMILGSHRMIGSRRVSFATLTTLLTLMVLLLR